jgi:hypothetical protein
MRATTGSPMRVPYRPYTDHGTDPTAWSSTTISFPELAGGGIRRRAYRYGKAVRVVCRAGEAAQQAAAAKEQLDKHKEERDARMTEHGRKLGNAVL